MKRISDTKRASIEVAKEDREAFALEFDRCWICNSPAEFASLPHATHEIVHGVNRNAGYAHRVAWLRLCAVCHANVHESWSLVEQYALKAMRDPEHYDRVELNRMRVRADDSVSEIEVVQAAASVLDKVWKRTR